MPKLSNPGISKLAKEIEAAAIFVQSDSSQLTIDIEDSRLAGRLLQQTTSEPVDSIYMLSVRLSQRLHELLDDEYSYDNIRLNYLHAGKQQYYFDFCIDNCQ